MDIAISEYTVQIISLTCLHWNDPLLRMESPMFPLRIWGKSIVYIPHSNKIDKIQCAPFPYREDRRIARPMAPKALEMSIRMSPSSLLVLIFSQ